jgi:tetratricopeptide (TPR) repeat protein
VAGGDRPRVVLLQVPAGWGRSTVLDQFAEMVDRAHADADAPVTIVIRVIGSALPEGRGAQACAMRDALASPWERTNRVTEALGLERLPGRVQLAIGVAGVFAPNPAAAAGYLLGSVGVGAAGSAWDHSAAGQNGAAAKAARALTGLPVPVAVLFDDAEQIDVGLALLVLENLMFRQDTQVLAVVAASPDSELAYTLRRSERPTMAGTVFVADADPDMGEDSRVKLARELSPRLADAGVRRIARRTRTFGEVFTVTAAEVLAATSVEGAAVSLEAAVDAVVDSRLDRGLPSAEAEMVAWAGGLVHARQTAKAMAARHAHQSRTDPYLVRSGSLVRRADPFSRRLDDAVRALDPAAQHVMAQAILDEAAALCADLDVSLLDRIVAARAAHRIREYLDKGEQEKLLGVQKELVAILEKVGDLDAAAEVGEQALAECPPIERFHQARNELTAVVLRLACTARIAERDQLVDELVAEAAAGGAAVGTEAMIWAAVTLLGMPDQRHTALMLTRRIAGDLDRLSSLGTDVASWRLLLAFHAGRAGYGEGLQLLLAPLLTCADTGLQDAARRVLHAVADRQADLRLRVAFLEAERQEGQPEEDLLGLHDALADAYDQLGLYSESLSQAERALALRTRLQGPDHPATLECRASIATLTAMSGDVGSALQLLTDLLSDRERVLGPDHLSTLFTWGNFAHWVGVYGHPDMALQLSQWLLPKMERLLGPDHPNTLRVRGNVARSAGDCGDAVRELRLLTDLLPDMQRVLGPDDASTLSTRNNIASAAGRCGDADGALRLFAELLADRERVLGADHPDTLSTRNNLIYWTGQSGKTTEALQLSAALLADQERVLGADHPDTMNTREGIAYWERIASS